MKTLHAHAWAAPPILNGAAMAVLVAMMDLPAQNQQSE
jgi:hypothetical protein